MTRAMRSRVLRVCYDRFSLSPPTPRWGGVKRAIPAHAPSRTGWAGATRSDRPSNPPRARGLRSPTPLTIACWRVLGHLMPSCLVLLLIFVLVLEVVIVKPHTWTRAPPGQRPARRSVPPCGITPAAPFRSEWGSRLRAPRPADVPYHTPAPRLSPLSTESVDKVGDSPCNGSVMPYRH